MLVFLKVYNFSENGNKKIIDHFLLSWILGGLKELFLECVNMACASCRCDG